MKVSIVYRSQNTTNKNIREKRENTYSINILHAHSKKKEKKKLITIAKQL